MNRLASLDYLRGLIMWLMALDHASAFVARKHFSEYWGVAFSGYPDIFWWFTRFVSHFCAPGFFLLMGLGMYPFASNRMQSGWSPARIRQYFLKRGALILAFMLLLELPAWLLGFSGSQVQESGAAVPGSYQGGFLLPATVLFGLGACMMIASILWHLKPWLLLLITAANFVLSGWYILQADPSTAFSVVEHMLLVPGMSDGAMVIYPVVPWLGVVTFGILFGKLIQTNGQKAMNYAGWAGAGMVSLFLVFRFFEWGNFQLNGYDDWISFFTLVKYPPSLAFILLTVGGNLVLLALLSAFALPSWANPMRLTGQTAMFFYIIHLYLFALIGWFFPLGTGVGWLYLVWMGGLLLLYFPCLWFRKFKSGKPAESFWRLI